MSASSPSVEPDPAKRLATARAALALRGIAVFDVGNGTFRASRWGWCREVDIAGLERLAERVGGAR